MAFTNSYFTGNHMTLQRRILTAGVLLAAVAATVVAQSPAPYGIVAEKDVMVTMRDGVRLATDIYRPATNGVAAAGTFPVIMDRTPYDKTSSPVVARAGVNHFVPLGYVVVVQDIRARYKSEGHWRLLADEPNDGYDTAKWLGTQSWFNGKLGSTGTSYEGATQHALALSGAPYLTAMIPIDAMSNFGHYGIRHNGAFELRWFNWVFTMGNATGTPNANAAAARAASDSAAIPVLADLGNHVREYVRQLPLRPGTTPLKLAPEYEAWLIEAMGHGDYDKFWKDAGASVVDHLAEYKDVPEYHVTGWYDSWGTEVANMNYVELHKAKKSLQRLIIGPWIHGSQARNSAGIAEFTADAALDLSAWEQRWFDRWLKGVDNGVDREPPVRIYVMGGGEPHKTPGGRLFVGGAWRDENEWPLARTAYTPYYLHANGSLSADKPEPSAPKTYRFDPRDPVPTLGGNISSMGQLMAQGAADQRCTPSFWLCTDSKPLSARSDVLVFQTAPLDRDIEVTGRLVVKLWAASDALDTDFSAKLVDVYPANADYPAGVDLNVGDGIVRARYRNSPEKAVFLKPNQPYEFTIEMYPTSLVFRRGHRIRVDISSSNFPRFDVNPNTGEPLNNNTRWQVANNSVFLDPQHPSRIILPVIPAKVQSGSR
jgi:hypothetical protein